jgi:hypothetical protein
MKMVFICSLLIKRHSFSCVGYIKVVGGKRIFLYSELESVGRKAIMRSCSALNLHSLSETEENHDSLHPG